MPVNDSVYYGIAEERKKKCMINYHWKLDGFDARISPKCPGERRLPLRRPIPQESLGKVTLQSPRYYLVVDTR